MDQLEHLEWLDPQVMLENRVLSANKVSRDPMVYPASTDFLVKLERKDLLDLLDPRVNPDKLDHPDYPGSPVKEDLQDYR